MSAILTLTVDDRTLATIAELGRSMNTSNQGEVIRRALALAKVAIANANPDSVVTLSDGQGREAQIKINA